MDAKFYPHLAKCGELGDIEDIINTGGICLKKIKFDNDLKHYDDLLTVEEQELIIDYLSLKIQYVESDIKSLRDDRTEYKDIFYRFINEEAVCRFLIKVQKDYKNEIIKENKKNEKLICGNSLDPKESKKPINVDFVLKNPFEKKWAEKLEKEREKIVDKVNYYKNDLLDSILFDLDYSKSCEASDIRYYKNVINKIKSDGLITYNDAQELWMMCDILECEGKHNDLHKSIIEKLKDYLKTINDEEETND